MEPKLLRSSQAVRQCSCSWSQDHTSGPWHGVVGSGLHQEGSTELATRDIFVIGEAAKLCVHNTQDLLASRKQKGLLLDSVLSNSVLLPTLRQKPKSMRNQWRSVCVEDKKEHQASRQDESNRGT